MAVTVGLVQINNSFSGQNYLPYAVALLHAYAQKNAADPSRYSFLLPIYKRIRIDAAVEHLSSADIVGFSTYVWNGRISLEIARRLKARRPETMILFGGPHVPDQPEDFLRANPWVDIVVHNEGERTFLDLLETYPDREAWRTVAGVSFIDGAGTYVHNVNGPRFRDLDEVPSPFLEGTFEPLMAANPHEVWIGLWETNRGCPFQCTFCDWGSATAVKVTKFGDDRLCREVDWFAAKKVEYVFCCDANFGIQKRDIDIVNYVAKVKRETGYPTALSVQNTKNATERAYQTQRILADAGLNKGVALSMQSVDPTTLEFIKRDNISLETYLELARRFSRDRIETYSDLILGLPGETYNSFTDGVDLLIENGQHNRIQFNNLSILPNAEMGNPAYQARYGMKTIESEIINIHGERPVLDDDVSEVQLLVTETASMPAADWRCTRVFCWTTALLHFDKILQLPLIVAHTVSGASYREMIESFIDVDADEYPTVASIVALFQREAKAIQEGGPEYVFSPEYLGIYWPADEFVFIRLVAENATGAFYAEARKIFAAILARHGASIHREIVDQAVAFNGALLRVPFVCDRSMVALDYDFLGFWNAVRNGEPATLVRAHKDVVIDRGVGAYDDLLTWCREVVWWGNKKGAYLYSGEPMAPKKELAGHF